LVISALFLSSILPFQVPRVNALSGSAIWDYISTEISLPSGEFKVSNVVETGDGLFIATDMEVYKSTDSGKTWTCVHNATVGIEALCLYATSKNWLIAVFLDSPYPAQRVSKDGGETWIGGSPSVLAWRTGVAELPNGTILMGMWGETNGGCIYKTNDGENYSLLWNFTQLFPDYPQNHTHAVGFNPYNNNIYVGLGDVIPKLLYVSSDYGENWVRYTADGPTGMWFEPDGSVYFGCDWTSDDIFKITSSNEIVKLNLINKYSATPHLHSIIRKNNVFYAGICSEFTQSPIGVAVSPDGDHWTALKIIDNKVQKSTTIKGGLLNDYLWIVLDDKLYKVRALEQSEVEHLINSEPLVVVLSGESDFASCAEGILADPKIRVYGVNVTNLVNNPSFETWSEEQPAEWTFYSYPPENWTTTLKTAIGLFGDRAVRVEASTTAETGIFGFSQWVSAEVGKSYTLSAYFRSNVTRTFEPYMKITGTSIDKYCIAKTVYENWTRIECTIDGMDSTSPMIEIGWLTYGTGTSRSGILLDIDGVLFQEGTKATPYIDNGTFATNNPKIKFGETWINYTGTIPDGSYREFIIDQDYLTGTFKIVPVIDGSKVAYVTILGTKIATVQNAVITMQNGESFAGICYGTPLVTGRKFITLVSSSNYGNLASHSFANHRLSVTISATPGSITTTRIYISNQAWETNCTSTNWNKTWESTGRVLTISALHEVAPIVIEIYEKPPEGGKIYGVEIYLAITVAAGGGILLAWWYHGKKKLRAVRVYGLVHAHRYGAAVLLAALAFTTLFLVYPMPELHWDAAGQAMVGVFWHDMISHLVLTGGFDGTEEFVATFLKHYENIAEVFYTPVFWGLVSSFTFFFFGISEAAYYSLVLFFAVVTIVVTYFLGSKLYDKRVGVISSLFLASSHALFGFTKSGTIDVPATAMVTLSMLAFLKAEANKRLAYSLLAGVLIGLSFMTKPTTAILVVAFALYLILKYLHARNRKIGKLIILRRFEKEKLREELGNFKIVLVPASILGLIQMYIWIRSDALSSWLYAFSGPAVISFPWYIYFSWILKEYLSPIVVALFMVGFAFSFYRRNNADLFLITWFATFLLFAILPSNRVPRYLLTLVPCLSIIAAQGLISVYNLAKEKLEILRRRMLIRNSIKTLFIFLIIFGVVNGFVLIQKDPYKNMVDFTNIDESPYVEVAKFLVENAGVTCVLPNYTGWATLALIGEHCSLSTLEFHIIKYDRQRATYFYGSYIPWEAISSEAFLPFLDWLSDNYDGKTVYLVVPYIYDWSTEFLESLDPPVRVLLEPHQKFIAYIESHSELVPLIKVFRGNGLEIRVYQRIKGAF